MKKLKKHNLRYLALVLLLSIFVAGCSDDNPANPTADFTFEIDPLNPTKVTFEAMATNGITLSWDFGDGSYSIAKKAQHTYAADGDYQVKLTIYGEDGSTPATAQETVTIVIPVFEPVALQNGNFELPGDGKHTNWDMVEGWNSDTTSSDSGVVSNDWWDAEIDNYRGYKLSSDPSFYNLTDYVITEYKQFKLELQAFDIWNGPQVTATLYFDSGDGSRNVIGTETFDLVREEWNSLSFVAVATPESVGAKLGIEISTASGDGGDGWTGFDNIELMAK
ncbi:PKD domain-containing protein [Tamlana flava]|uniref:PKD domain-containing protein n=1 Tax=Tamlana flava TaxID=3158572 RepID=UPI00351BDE1A